MGRVQIDRAAGCVTVVNVFRVRDSRQVEAVEHLQAVNARIAREPGYISASVHRSFDGQRVANYAQWSSGEAISVALHHPDLVPLLARLAEVGEGDWHLYEVVSTDMATDGSR